MARNNEAPKGDSEKITINLGFIDLGHIDLLVRDGHYANRTDLIRTAIRNQLGQHRDVLGQAVTRRRLVLGIVHITKSELEAARARGETLEFRVLGLGSIAFDVTPELARETIASLTVLGTLHAPAAVKAALTDRLH